MHLKKWILSLGICAGFVSHAGTMGMPPPPKPMVEVLPWSVTASIGYTSFDDAAEGQGQNPLGRLAIEKSVCDFGESSLGIELGVQNGVTMDLFVPQVQDLDSGLGGVPITARISPMLDLLIDWRWSATPNLPTFLNIKGGLAYRRLDVLGRTTIGNKSQFAGEIQGGAGMAITEMATLSLLYQGVFGGDLDLTVTNDTLGTATIGNIPVQNGILLSLNILLNT